MDNINTERFNDKAEIYQQYRASYPKDLIEYLYSAVGFSNTSIIADIGSGTGIFSRLLLEKGNQVFCVEPNNDMRGVAEKELGCIAGFYSVAAPAENTGLKENSIDFITAAQAFHWFDRQLFKLECRRILNQTGKVVLIWNIRDYTHDIVKKDLDIRKKYSIGDAKGLSSDQNPMDEHKGFFINDKCDEMTFANNLQVKRNDYIGMNLSRSYAPSKEKNPEMYNGFVTDLANLFDEYSHNKILIYPQVTKCYIGRV